MSKPRALPDENLLWCLYDRLHDNQEDSLSLSEAHAICRILTVEQRQHWFVWCEGWSNWKPMNECNELLDLLLEREREVSPPVPPSTFRREKKEMLVKTVVEKEIIPRKNERIPVRYGVEIIVNNQNFCSHSSDISLGGVRLEDPLPSWVAGYCTLIVTNEKGQKLEFVATIVENQRTADKTRLEFHSSASLVILQEWLTEKSIDRSITKTKTGTKTSA